VKRFARLYRELDETTRTSDKVAALRGYFEQAPPEDAAWALMCLAGKRLKRTVSVHVLRDAVMLETSLPAWMLGECYDAVGDWSETMALLLPAPGTSPDLPLHSVFRDFIMPMGAMDAPGAVSLLRRAWRMLPSDQIFLFHKLISGTFRVGAARGLVVRALAEAADLDPDTIAHRLSGRYEPTPDAYRALLAPRSAEDATHPYPFCLAHQLDDAPDTLGDAREWLAEWKWDGIRAQLIRRAGRTSLWSRGEGAIGAQFPEIVRIGDALPDGTVLDGEVLAWLGSPGEGSPLPFNDLQTRLGRKDLQPSLFDTTIVLYMGFDQLKRDGCDIRTGPLHARRASIEATVRTLLEARPDLPLRVSPLLPHESWEELGRAREQASIDRASEGLMLKHRDSVYHVGRVRGDPAAGNAGWWKWKVDPFTVDAVLLYAQPGSGRRAGLYTDYTFAVWHGDQLVPFAKAYSGLTDEEIRRVDAFVRRHTLDRRGPVRFLEPRLVFEIAFQEIHLSARHRSGVAVRFPRIARWREDKTPDQADTLDTLLSLISL
jgi:DNA ligase-1